MSRCERCGASVRSGEDLCPTCPTSTTSARPTWTTTSASTVSPDLPPARLRDAGRRGIAQARAALRAARDAALDAAEVRT